MFALKDMGTELPTEDLLNKTFENSNYDVLLCGSIAVSMRSFVLHRFPIGFFYSGPRGGPE